jgi:hypothetical protein
MTWSGGLLSLVTNLLETGPVELVKFNQVGTEHVLSSWRA